MTHKFKQTYINAAELLPVKLLLDEHVSPKSVVKVFTAMDFPMEIIGNADMHVPFHRYGVPVKFEQSGVSWSFPIKELDTPNPNQGLKSRAIRQSRQQAKN